MNIMKKSFLGALLSLGLLSAAHADVYKFDNTHTNAVFNIDHFQTSTNHGGFYAISGELKYQPEKQVAEMRVTIPVSALNTGVDGVENPIGSSYVRVAEGYPERGVKSTKGDYEYIKQVCIDGWLTSKGVMMDV
ncbi:YceI family protein, partial [Salmonella enterica]|uniref:YceI family protein n=1 Tax=Salmonella enterica TaxID=28901 RepID=UPI001125A4DA